MTFEASLSEIRARFASDKVTKRREAAKLLNTFLDCEECLRALDENTNKLWPHQPVLATTWPGLCAELMRFLLHEIDTNLGKKKGPDVNLAKLFKKFVQAAENTNRSGRPSMLLRWSGRIFDHMQRVFELVQVASPIGTEYNSILRAHLLTATEYCACASASTFEGLVEVHLAAMDATTSRNAEEIHKIMLSTIAMLIRQCPSDISTDYQESLVAFFIDHIKQVELVRDAPRVVVAYFTCINNFLLRYGLDVSGLIKDLHAALHPFIISIWKGAPSPQVQPVVLLYLRIYLRLGGGSLNEGQLREIFLLMHNELDKWSLDRVSFAWSSFHNDSLTLTNQQRAFAAMMGALIYRLNAFKRRRPAASHEYKSSKKRVKFTEPLDVLEVGFIQNPWKWSPTFCALLEQHAECLERDAFEQLLGSMERATAKVCDSMCEDDAALDVTGWVWTIRGTQFLANHWPSNLKYSVVRNSSLESKWKTVRDAVVKAPIRDPLIKEEVLQFLKLLSANQIVPGDKLCATIVQLQALEAVPFSHATTEIIPCLLTDPCQKTHDYQHSVEGCLASIHASGDICSISNALRALMNLAKKPISVNHPFRKLGDEWKKLDADSMEIELALSALCHGVDVLNTEAHQVRERAAQSKSSMPCMEIQRPVIGNVQQFAAKWVKENLEKVNGGDTEEGSQSVSCLMLLRLCVLATEFLTCVEEGYRASSAAAQIAQLKVELGNSLELLGPQISQALHDLNENVEEIVPLAKWLSDGILQSSLCMEITLLRSLDSWLSHLEQCFGLLWNAATMEGREEPDGMFVDELDLGGTGARAKEMKSANQCLIYSLELIGCFVPLLDGQDNIVQRIASHVNESDVAPPEDVRNVLMHVTCLLAAKEKGQMLVEAIELLEGELSLVNAKKFHCGRVEFVLDHILKLLHVDSHESSWLLTSPSPCVTHLNGRTASAFIPLMQQLLSLRAEAIKAKTLPSNGGLHVKFGKLIAYLAKVDSANYSSIAREMVLDLAKHRSYVVRRSSIGILCSFLQDVEDKESFLDAVCMDLFMEKSFLSPDQVDSAEKGKIVKPRLETEVQLLVGMAGACVDLECDAMVKLCFHAVVDSEGWNLVQSGLALLSSALGYPSLAAFFSFHSSQFIITWFTEQHTFDQFGLLQQLIMQETESSRDVSGKFLGPYCPTITTALVLGGEEEALKILADIMQCSVRSMLEAHLPILVGFLTPKLVCGDPDDREVARMAMETGIIVKYLTNADVRQIVVGKLVEIVGVLVLRAEDVPEEAGPSGPFYPVAWIVKSVTAILNEYCPKMRLNGCQISWLLVHLHKNLNRICHARHKVQFFGALKSVVEIVGDQVCSKGFFRYLIRILLLQIHVSELQSSSCELLRDILEKLITAAHRDASLFPALGHVLRDLASSVVECIEQTSVSAQNTKSTPESDRFSTPQKPRRSRIQQNLAVDSGVGGNARELVGLLEMLLECSELHGALREIEPFPDIPEFDKVREIHTCVRSDVTLKEQLGWFVKRGTKMTEAARYRAVQNLRHLVKDKRESGLDPTSSSRGMQNVAGDIRPLAWSLAQMGWELDDDMVCDLAGEILGMLGPLDPYTIAFHAVSPGSKSRMKCLSNPLLSHLSARSAEPIEALKTSFHSVKKEVLRNLSECLLDDNVQVIECAQATVCQLLKMEGGRKVLTEAKKSKEQWVDALSVFENGNLPDVVLQHHIDASDSGKEIGAIESDEFWMSGGDNYEVWVCALARSLLCHVENDTLGILKDMVSLKAEFAELLIPYILLELATVAKQGSAIQELLSQKISTHILCQGTEGSQREQLIIGCLEFLRKCRCDWMMRPGPGKACGWKKRRQFSSQTEYLTPDKWKKVYWLDLDYLLVASAAFRCSACFTAMLYVECWSEERHNGLKTPEPELVGDTGELPGAAALLLEIYRTINEPDGLYAIAKTPHITSRLARLEHEGNWSQAMALYDLALSQPTSDSGPPKHSVQVGLTQCLQQLGCHSTLSGYLNAMHKDSKGLWQSEQAEVKWRMGQWGEVAVGGSGQESSLNDEELGQCFHGRLCQGLECLKDGRVDGFVSDVHVARCEMVKSLAKVKMESLASVNPALVNLQSLDMLVEGWRLRWPRNPLRDSLLSPAKAFTAGSTGASPTSTVYGSPSVSSQTIFMPSQPQDTMMERLECMWENRQQLAGSEERFDLEEKLLMLHGGILRCLGRDDRLPDLLTRTAVRARKAGKLPAAQSALQELRALTLSNKNAAEEWASSHLRPDSLWRLEEAKLLWRLGERDTAIHFGKFMIEQLRCLEDGSSVVFAQWLCIVGKWLAGTLAESSSHVMGLMTEAADIIKGSSWEGGGQESDVACKVLYRLAKYADQQYRGIKLRKTSQEWLTSKAVIQQKRESLKTLEKRLSKTTPTDVKRALRYHIDKLKRPIEADEHEAFLLEKNERRFMEIALRNYKGCLLASDRYDLPVVFRICQLWFELGDERKVNSLVTEAFEQVPSYKFLPLVYQIASRMTARRAGPLVESGFHKSLDALIVRLAVDHPYHTLYQLFALKNGNLGSDGKAQSGPVQMVMSHDVDMDKVEAAGQILQRVCQEPGMRAIVSQMERLVQGYIKLAAAKTAPNAMGMDFPTSILRTISELDKVPIVSVELPVQRSGDYQFAHFKCFGRKIKFVGGINQPKLITCVDSNGVEHRELVKSGNDDLRQDAVMQQFFRLVNSLLRECSATRKRQLNVTTYKVVPFSPGAGLLEWVENTLPLADYLLGPDKRGGAHARYKKQGDYTYVECFHKLNGVSKPQELKRIFDDVCKHFSPVLHHFFLERFRNPAEWFEKRTAYTRSTAANSIAGYIIGLGDRHASNILIKNSTAEVVHIDLGIAFEQGRFLNTPELAPFRLTRDIVDGMGINGVEGTMRRCCEETLRVLRGSREALITIIEVFIHDPLYKWALTPIKAQRRQREDNYMGEDGVRGQNTFCEEGFPGLGNADAERALIRVKQKLDGIEDGEQRGIEGQVQKLIQDAQNADILCAMFPGWSPWL